MKRILLCFAACSTLSFHSYSQCTPNPATGTAGVTPTPDNVTCIERGVPYSIVMQIENFSSLAGGLATVNSATIDSLQNFPCGISWQANKLTLAGGETGCILVSGTTTDAIGQYPLRIFMTLSVTVPLLGQTFTPSGEITALIDSIENLTGQTIPIDLSYYSRVINPGSGCPPIDRSPAANNLTSSGATCPTSSLAVSITGDNSICAGESTTLTANVSNASGTVTYTWSSGGSGQTKTVSPASTTSYSVTVNDQNGSATSSITVTVSPRPNAAFSATPSGRTVTINNTSTGGATYSWNFGDSQTSTAQSPSPHTYAADGNYTITLIVTSSAGCKDTATQSVTIGCPLPSASFTAVASGQTVTINNTSTGGSTFSWNFGDNQTSTAQNPPAHTYTSGGNYTITLIVTNSCGSDTATQNVSITGVFIPSPHYTLSFDVFPNPGEGSFTVQINAGNSGKSYELKVFDLAGKKLFNEKMTGDALMQKQLDMSWLAKGSYLLQIGSQEGFGIKKIVLR